MSTAAERSAFGGYCRLASPLEGSFYTLYRNAWFFGAYKHASEHPVPVDIDMNVIHITYKYNIYDYMFMFHPNIDVHSYIHSSKLLPCPSRVHI